MESLGLVNLATCDIDRPAPFEDCPCGAKDCRHLRTYRRIQLDWLYATPELARQCAAIRVDHGVMDALSDHAPVVAEFDLSRAEHVRVCAAESFLDELAPRSGQQAAVSSRPP